MADAESKGRWVLWRTGDDGNRFQVATFATRAEAEAACRAYEARGHKQLYEVEEARGGGAAPA